LPVDHDENFPVASWLLPARLREPIEALYGFARGADDVADEGDATDAERLAALDPYVEACDAIDEGLPVAPRFARIARAVRDYRMSVPLLRDLISAFKQDVAKKRYATFDELLDYSRRSANPVGRLVLQVFHHPHPGPPPGERESDSICTALQLINFWQDVAVDWRKGRVYIPQEDLARFGVSEGQIARGEVDAAWRDLMCFECERARQMLHAGYPLAASLPGRLGLEIRATIAGGAIILDRIEAAGGDVFRRRPVLGARDWARILARAFFKRAPEAAAP
jgi:phytoene synthase